MIFLLNFVHFEAIFAYSETDLLILKQKSPTDLVEDSFVQLGAWPQSEVFGEDH